MSFYQGYLLWGLLLAGLPLLIHLINRQRHRTIPWAAMMFLLDAKRMTKGMARLRFWLIMLMRMLAIAGLIFAIARPLASGRFGLALGGKADTVVVVLDRSASMEQKAAISGKSKRTTALDKIADLLKKVGGNSEIVLVENTENKAIILESAAALPELPETGESATSADIPAMLQTALDHVNENQTGRTDIWICSDVRDNDWHKDDGRWKSIQQGFEKLDGVRFYLLNYPDVDPDNISVRVSNVRRRQIGRTAELVMDISVKRDSDSTQLKNVPLEFVINGARSVLNVELTEREFTLQGHAMEIDESIETGWGQVEIPPDSNMQDNLFAFVFAEPSVLKSTIVAEETLSGGALQLALTSGADPALKYEADIIKPSQAAGIDWNSTTLLIWQAPLPDGLIAQQIKSFVDSGRPVIFFPPGQSNSNEAFGASWELWTQSATSVPISQWRFDSGLLKNANSGTSLPLGKLKTYRFCGIKNGGNVLARYQDGQPLLTRVDTNGAPVYFCATLPQFEYSSLAQDGVAFYVMLHRALMIGMEKQGKAKLLTAGSSAAKPVVEWSPLSPSAKEVVSASRPFLAGAYEKDEKFVALNRPAGEDLEATLDDATVDGLFAGLEFHRVEDRVGTETSLASEIWRAFLFLMALALIVEAILCMPDKKIKATELADEPTRMAA